MQAELKETQEELQMSTEDLVRARAEVKGLAEPNSGLMLTLSVFGRLTSGSCGDIR